MKFGPIIGIIMLTFAGLILYVMISCIQGLRAAEVDRCVAIPGDYNHKVKIEYGTEDINITIPCLSEDYAIFNTFSKAKDYDIRFKKYVGQPSKVR